MTDRDSLHPMLTDPALAHLPLVAYAEPWVASAPLREFLRRRHRPIIVPSPSEPKTVAYAALGGDEPGANG